MINETVWNESQVLTDPLTGRTVRRLTTQGLINQTPTYHTNSGFTADSRFLVFASVRGGATWIIRAEPATGELKALWRAPGIGDRNYIHRGMALDAVDANTSPNYRPPTLDGCGICGNRVCVAPNSGLAVFTCQRTIHAVNIITGEQRVLLDDAGEQWIFGAPCVSPDEQYVVIALSSAHPQRLARQNVSRDYRSYHNHRLRLIRVPLDGARTADVIFEHEPAQCAHCAFSPTNPNLLYFDLDLPRHYWGGGDGRTQRAWLLDLQSGNAWPARPEADGLFETHTAWLWDGSALCYHGGSPLGECTGLVTPDRRILWQRYWPTASFYGHSTPDPNRPALIIDGLFADDRLQWLYYDQPGNPKPRLEPICSHATQWGSIPGQYSHPHPLTDRAGRWISFTAAHNGRSDVYVVGIDGPPGQATDDR